MVGNRSTGTSLFDLLARAWTFDEEITQTQFNCTGTSVLFRLRSGRLALASTLDSESPQSRTRIEADTGRTTIRQRKNPIPEARVLPITVHPDLPVVRMGEQSFLAIDSAGVPHQITAKGQCIEKTTSFISPIFSTLCSSRNGSILAIAGANTISIHDAANLMVLTEIDHERTVSAMAFSEAGDILAVWGEGCLTLIDIEKPATPVRHIQGIDDATQINWDRSGKYLACTSDTCAFWIVDIQSETVQKVEGYPHPVSVANFSESGKALITSGAFRLAGWSTDDLPQNDEPGTPLSSGKPGLVVINTIASHPTRSLVAAGYLDGLITITSIGTAQEMMVHKENDTEINALSWSDAGEHLSIGFKSGKAAVVTFPDKLFK